MNAVEAVSIASASSSGALPRADPEDAGMSPTRVAHIAAVRAGDCGRGQLPGAVVAIARRGKLVAHDAYGYRDKAAGLPMTTDCIFNIASMTKPMTAVAALMLVEEGRLQLDEPLWKYFPKIGANGVAIVDETGAVVRTEHPTRSIVMLDLMRHTCGMPYGSSGATVVHRRYPHGSSAAAAAMTGSEFLDRLGSVPLVHHPGTVWDYGFGLDVLGLVVEKVTGQALGQFLEARVFGPLRVRDTAL